MTGTELLFAVADRFATFGEAEDIVVIWSDEQGRVRMKSNCNYTRSLGLVTYAEADIKHTLTHSDGGDTDAEGNPDA